MHDEFFTVLVVEDNTSEALLLREAFLRVGRNISAQFVANGEEAIEYLGGAERFANRALFPEPNLVIMDLKMPRLGGFEVLEWFRNLQEGALIPVIVLTASSSDDDVQRAYSLGANTYFLKPTSFEDFRNLVKKIHDYWSLACKPRPLSARS